MMKKLILSLFFAGLFTAGFAQSDRWQQHAVYEMEIDFDVSKHQYTGTQKLTYTNNSPDTLTKVFYHLYLNAFQPGSQMDVRSRSIADPDPRVRDRISRLKPDEIGYEKVKSLTQNKKAVKYTVNGTILEVTPAEPILPGSKHVFQMEFEAQVPSQIRRTGRFNSEGVDYSMAQWYPKMSEYDYEGWHANPYIAREFYGIWGDFDVKITIDASFVLAGTGYLQNADKIGYGYSKKEIKHQAGSKLTWHFKAPKVHDFVWAADPEYRHDIAKVDDDLELHFFYRSDSIAENWKALQPEAVKCFREMNKKFGRYPYKQYSVIQGGDGGMEYPMATLITGGRNLQSLFGVTFHESIHSWFQMLLGSNESKYSWMDEGFTSYADGEVSQIISGEKSRNPHYYSHLGYQSIAKSGKEEPLTTHSDHYNTNRGYGIAAYSKGAVFLDQLSYVIGREAFDRAMLRYFYTWRFKHPNPTDLKRIMEKESGLELDWYLENFVGTTKQIDYGIKEVDSDDKNTSVVLARIGEMPMPLDVIVTYNDGSTENFYIPMEIMRGEKADEKIYDKTTLLSDWAWTYPEYSFKIPRKRSEIKSIELDPSGRMSDVNRDNNIYPGNSALRLEGK